MKIEKEMDYCDFIPIEKFFVYYGNKFNSYQNKRKKTIKLEWQK